MGHFLFDTCYLIHAILFLLYATDYLKLAIACNKIATFLSCSATPSCWVYLHSEVTQTNKQLLYRLDQNNNSQLEISLQNIKPWLSISFKNCSLELVTWLIENLLSGGGGTRNTVHTKWYKRLCFILRVLWEIITAMTIPSIEVSGAPSKCL